MLNKILIISGPTATGKTDLAVRLAKKYNGTFNLRFDDTNPMKEKTEFVESIVSDVEWLGAKYDGDM